MYIPEINSKIKLNGKKKKDDIRCANNYMGIVLGFLFLHTVISLSGSFYCLSH